MMSINRFQTGQRRLPAAIQLPWKVTQFRNRIESALPAHVSAWAEEQARKIAREPDNWTWQQTRLGAEIRSRFLLLAHTPGIDMAVFERNLRFIVMCNLYDNLTQEDLITLRDEFESKFKAGEQRKDQNYNVLITLVKTLKDLGDVANKGLGM